MTNFFHVEFPAGEIDELVCEWAGNEGIDIVAVEIFDHPETQKHREKVWGPWIVGPTTEVLEWLAHHRYKDWEEQYSSGPTNKGTP